MLQALAIDRETKRPLDAAARAALSEDRKYPESIGIHQFYESRTHDVPSRRLRKIISQAAWDDACGSGDRRRLQAMCASTAAAGERIIRLRWHGAGGDARPAGAELADNTTRWCRTWWGATTRRPWDRWPTQRWSGRAGGPSPRPSAVLAVTSLAAIATTKETLDNAWFDQAVALGHRLKPDPEERNGLVFYEDTNRMVTEAEAAASPGSRILVIHGRTRHLELACSRTLRYTPRCAIEDHPRGNE